MTLSRSAELSEISDRSRQLFSRRFASFLFKPVAPVHKIPESSDKLCQLILPPKGTPPADFWSPYAAYAIEVGKQVQFESKSPVGNWFIAFFHGVNRKESGKGKYAPEVLRIVRGLQTQRPHADYFIAEPGVSLQGGTEFKYLHIWKGYSRFDPEIIARDLVSLIDATFDDFCSMKGS